MFPLPAGEGEGEGVLFATNPRQDTLLGLAHGLNARLELVPFDHIAIPRSTYDEMVWRDEHQLDDESLKRHSPTRSAVDGLIIPDED